MPVEVEMKNQYSIVLSRQLAQCAILPASCKSLHLRSKHQLTTLTSLALNSCISEPCYRQKLIITTREAQGHPVLTRVGVTLIRHKLGNFSQTRSAASDLEFLRDATLRDLAHVRHKQTECLCFTGAGTVDKQAPLWFCSNRLTFNANILKPSYCWLHK